MIVIAAFVITGDEKGFGFFSFMSGLLSLK